MGGHDCHGRMHEQLEAARDADCAEWRKQQTELGCSPEVEQCIRALGGKP